MRRLSSQLPLAIAVVVLAVVSTFSWFAFREVRAAAWDSAEQRLHDVSLQLANLLGQSANQAKASMVQSASASTLVRDLSTGVLSAPAREALQQLLESGNQNAVVEVWDSRGTSLARLARPDSVRPVPASETFPTWLAGDTVGISPFAADDDRAWYDIAAAIRANGLTLGYLVQRRVLTATPTAVRTFSDLIGRESSIRVGTPGGVWTDLAGPVEGPPNVPMGELVEYQGADNERRIGFGMAVPGAPWSTWTSVPQSVVLARAESFLARIIPIALGIVVVGGLGAWVVLRSLTAPLKRVTVAATSMAAGDYEHRVRIQGPHELSSLANAFNHMADRIQDAQQDLERRVEERTAELRASEDQFRNVAATARDTIIMADAKGRLTYFNAGAENAFQYHAGEVVGQPLTMLMPERFHVAHQQAFERYVATGEARVVGRTVELIGRRKDGTEFPLELSLASWNNNGERAFAGIIRDITAWKESEAELKRYAAQLEAANEELEAFAYSVSHDLRAPLRAVHGYCHVLVEDYAKQLDEDGVRYAGRVSAGVERMGRLIDDLLELSRVTRAEMSRETVRLDLLADEVIDDLRRDVYDREVEFRIARGLEVEGDSRLLHLVMQNLLGNAWKFTAKRRQGTIEVGAVQGEDHTFFVRDNGAGFDMTYADKLFGAFQRLHKSADFPGTGVGLAIVYRIIQRHGGQVWAEGAEGRGATFYFTIPTLTP